MKLSLVVALCALFAVGQAGAAEKIELKTEKDKESYQKGYYQGNSFKRLSIDVDRKIFLRGVEDAISGAETLLTKEEMVEIERKTQDERNAKAQEERKKIADKNKKEGDAFLAANAKKKGVKTLPSGVQYKVIAEGKGGKPKAEDKVKVNFRMSQIDGTVVEDTDKRPEHPVVMPVGGDKRYIPLGWTEVLQLMQEGSKYQIFCPPHLGFGEQGMGPIGANEVVIFEVELVSIEKAEKAATTENKKN